jgi:hypothetical protein
MKKLIILLGIFLCVSGYRAQTTLYYGYDGNGNMTQRNILVIPNTRLNMTDKKDSLVRPDDYKVYPNPANDVLTIEASRSSNEGTSHLFFRNSNGMLLKQEQYKGNIKTLKVDDLPSGVYILEINTGENKSSSYKVIISN